MTVERKLYFRMLNAVFGHYNALKWNLMEECEFATEDRTAQMEYIKAIDPYDHPVTYQVGGIGISYDTYNSHLGQTGGIDAASFQGGASRGSMFNTIQSWRSSSAAAGVKWTCAWDEPQRIDNDNNDEVQGYPMGRRDKMWPCLMGGGDGFMWYIQKDGGGHGFDQRIEDFTIMQNAFNWSGHARTFLGDLPLLEMSSSMGIVNSTTGTDYALVKSGEIYAIFNDRVGTGMSLDLRGISGDFSVQWFDPRNGGLLQAGTVTTISGGDWRALGDPPSELNQDWAVLVKRVTGTPHTLNVNGGSGSGSYYSGSVVSIVANAAPEGLVFDQWTGDVATVTNVNSASTTLVMPAASISLSATYKEAPPVLLAINCGGGAHTTTDGINYVADESFAGGNTYTSGDAIAGTTDDALYQSERWGSFTYDVPVGNGSYEVLLQFAEIYATSNGSRVFDVMIEGVTVVGDLDVHAVVGHDAAHDVLVSGVDVTDGALTITVFASVDNPKLSAFRILTPTSDYTQWAALYPTADLSNPDDDHDGDGLSNANERIFGTDPTSGASGNPIAVPLDRVAGTFSYTRRDDSLTGLVYTIWTSADLNAWTEDSGALQSAGDPNAQGVELVHVTITSTLLSNPSLFIQVRAE